SSPRASVSGTGSPTSAPTRPSRSDAVSPRGWRKRSAATSTACCARARSSPGSPARPRATSSDGYAGPGPYGEGAMTDHVPVLMYHSVTENPPSATRSLSVRPSDLDWQLRYLRDNGFTGLTFTDMCTRTRKGRALPERPIVLTFDDGYADTHEEALPLLQEYG